MPVHEKDPLTKGRLADIVGPVHPHDTGERRHSGRLETGDARRRRVASQERLKELATAFFEPLRRVSGLQPESSHH